MKQLFPLAGTARTVACILGIMAGLSINSSAYVLEGPSWPNGVTVVLQMNLGAAGRTLQDGNTNWNSAAVPATTMWNQQIQRAQLSTVLNGAGGASTGDHLNSVVFANSVFGQPFGANTLAVTYYRYSGDTMSEADTLFNQAKAWDSYRGLIQYPVVDIRRVFLHELGHTLGLGHPDQAGQNVVAIMNSIIGDQETLSADDIAGAHVLYGAAPSPTPVPTPGPGVPSHLANISTRMRVGIGDDVLIGGFIIGGPNPKTVILRAIGPSLAGTVANALSDPVLELHDSAGVIASNDDWTTGSQVFEILSTGLAPTDDLESAIIMTLSPGTYTAIVSGWSGAQGIGLVEAYELDGNTTRMLNISTRGRVSVGSQALIGGLIVQGVNAKRVIVRALGPSLASGPIPVASVLANPILELHDSSGALIALNDNWTSSPQQAEITATGLAPPNSVESAIIATFGPGNYTAIVRGVNDSSGLGLVEVYDLDP